MQVASAKDKNSIVSNMGFYGIIQEIWDLDYRKFRIPVLRCDWVDNTSGLVVDELGFTLVDLSKIGHRNDQFVMASQVKPVFYVDDPMHHGWLVVLSMPNREYNDVIGDDVLGYTRIECEPFTRGIPNVDTFYDLVACDGTTVHRRHRHHTPPLGTAPVPLEPPHSLLSIPPQRRLDPPPWSPESATKGFSRIWVSDSGHFRSFFGVEILENVPFIGETLPKFRQKVSVFSKWARHRDDVWNSKGFVSDFGKIRGGSFHARQLLSSTSSTNSPRSFSSQKVEKLSLRCKKE
ncbi:hypothetical protein L3X38_024364 [Prunus dulcis]|uniref:DUF4216 domain-containing protein n=1 Tax=Prunus dulcis TaxID=3755 RepID=A0AAD4W272_PRUDU|nr:hypothetical protein L3X38_024364 [Prunus dulcis]